ncbi:TVP38/TMEM64 family protein [Nocardiopsis sp. MG754419]|uniref:TVP38/TMEM64 family protein n=1 Tax=Nocardiopsis sp. MG754419 TaxID=2259865 RepID=UPI001BAC1E85|nr:TVP38/TMEM64 family protein [Nocardiopsis sp. MG754419]MBR8742899.1 TVP38/TMEM64 family protein [Nocardiopsis sp. MG754419]
MENTRRRLPRAALLAAWVALLVWTLLFGPDPEVVRAWTADAGTAGFLAYLAAYVLAVQALVPRPALNVAGGVLFGPVSGLALALVGGVLAALAQFLVARYVAGDALARRLPTRVRGYLEGLAGPRALLAVVQLRLIPVIPYQMVNYGFGLTMIPVTPFVVGTALGSVPATAAMVLIGAGGTDLGLPVAVGTGTVAVLIAVVWWAYARRSGPGRGRGPLVTHAPPAPEPQSTPGGPTSGV